MRQRDVLIVPRSLSNGTEVNLRGICENLFRQYRMTAKSLSWISADLKSIAYDRCLKKENRELKQRIETENRSGK